MADCNSPEEVIGIEEDSRDTGSDIKSSDVESGDTRTTSDASSASMKSSDGYVPGTNEPNTSGSSDSDIVFSSDEDSAEDVEATIDFLRQKQGILKRASSVLFDHEEAYNAATARATSRADVSDAPLSNVWTRAKRMVPNKKHNARRVASGPSGGDRKTAKPSPRDPQINLDEVDQVGAGRFDASDQVDEGDNSSTEGLPEVAFPQGQWMAKALIRSSLNFSMNEHANPHECRWKVISDPITCSLGLVPPSSISMEHGISIEEALSISEEGRLLTQATPPFCVVYVNKAFMILTGIKTKEALIGKPVESILRVRQDILGTPKISVDEDFLSAHFMRNAVAPLLPDDESAGEQFVSCRMMTVPVMDRSRRRRLTPHARHAKAYSCLSHILIRVRGSDRAVSPLSNASSLEQLDDLFAISDSDVRKDEDLSSSASSNQDSIQSNMMGTIG